VRAAARGRAGGGREPVRARRAAERQRAGSSGWKDTVLLNDKEMVDILIRFTEYRGAYVMHCHQLEHESMGMMMNFEVD
jgi:spore coat protein A, manganese oxidase